MMDDMEGTDLVIMLASLQLEHNRERMLEQLAARKNPTTNVKTNKVRESKVQCLAH